MSIFRQVNVSMEQGEPFTTQKPRRQGHIEQSLVGRQQKHNQTNLELIWTFSLSLSFISEDIVGVFLPSMLPKAERSWLKSTETFHFKENAKWLNSFKASSSSPINSFKQWTLWLRDIIRFKGITIHLRWTRWHESSPPLGFFFYRLLYNTGSILMSVCGLCLFRLFINVCPLLYFNALWILKTFGFISFIQTQWILKNINVQVFVENCYAASRHKVLK